MRALLASDDPRAAEAIELFAFRVAREVAAKANTLGGLECLVFTGGIGEHSAEIRQQHANGCSGWERGSTIRQMHEGRSTDQGSGGVGISNGLKSVEHSKKLARRFSHEHPAKDDDLCVIVLNESGAGTHREPVYPAPFEPPSQRFTTGSHAGLSCIKSPARLWFLLIMQPATRVGFSKGWRPIMLTNLLVHIPSERLIRPVVDGAISLAVSHAAHLHAISVGYESTNVGPAVDVGGAAVAAVFEIERERALARANAALAVFQTEARNAGITYNCQAIASVPVEAAASVSASARLHDLTIVLQPEPDRDTFDNIMPQEILFESGGPVLFIPYTHKGPLVAKRIGIAWDGSRLAARALRDAAPFLTRAQAITIISINEVQAPAEASAKAVSAHLARYGVTVRIQQMDADRADIQPSILSIAADDGLDLIVMGAYGHSRLRERILGGVTRGMIRSMTVPTLMSH